MRLAGYCYIIEPDKTKKIKKILVSKSLSLKPSNLSALDAQSLRGG